MFSRQAMKARVLRAFVNKIFVNQIYALRVIQFVLTTGSVCSTFNKCASSLVLRFLVLIFNSHGPSIAASRFAQQRRGNTTP